LVHRGHKIVEVASQQVSKGASLEALIQQSSPELIVAIGDDRTDESMFRRRDIHPNLEAIKVGPGETLAAWRLGSVTSARAFLAEVIRRRR
jgi:trehalose-6-phosphatase